MRPRAQTPRAADLSIHPTAVVAASAEIADDVEIGPFCVIAERVVIGPGTVLESHVRLGDGRGPVLLGRDNLVQSGAVLGGAPQDYGYRDSETALVIGDRNRIGEYVSISRGTDKGGGVTRIGDDNFIMAFVHLGHDCRLDHHVTITNGTQLAGHVTLEHHVLLSGLAGLTQFVRVGAYAFLTAGAFANKDIVPYTIAEGHWAAPRAVNRVGLKRAGFATAERKNVERAVKTLLDRGLTVDEALERISAECEPTEAIAHFVDFVRSSERGVARP